MSSAVSVVRADAALGHKNISPPRNNSSSSIATNNGRSMSSDIQTAARDEQRSPFYHAHRQVKFSAESLAISEPDTNTSPRITQALTAERQPNQEQPTLPRRDTGDGEGHKSAITSSAPVARSGVLVDKTVCEEQQSIHRHEEPRGPSAVPAENQVNVKRLHGGRGLLPPGSGFAFGFGSISPSLSPASSRVPAIQPASQNLSVNTLDLSNLPSPTHLQLSHRTKSAPHAMSTQQSSNSPPPNVPSPPHGGLYAPHATSTRSLSSASTNAGAADADADFWAMLKETSAGSPTPQQNQRRYHYLTRSQSVGGALDSMAANHAGGEAGGTYAHSSSQGQAPKMRKPNASYTPAASSGFAGLQAETRERVETLASSAEAWVHSRGTRQLSPIEEQTFETGADNVSLRSTASNLFINRPVRRTPSTSTFNSVQSAPLSAVPRTPDDAHGTNGSFNTAHNYAHGYSYASTPTSAGPSTGHGTARNFTALPVIPASPRESQNVFEQESSPSLSGHTQLAPGSNPGSSAVMTFPLPTGYSPFRAPMEAQPLPEYEYDLGEGEDGIEVEVEEDEDALDLIQNEDGTYAQQIDVYDRPISERLSRTPSLLARSESVKTELTYLTAQDSGEGGAVNGSRRNSALAETAEAEAAAAAGKLASKKKNPVARLKTSIENLLSKAPGLRSASRSPRTTHPSTPITGPNVKEKDGWVARRRSSPLVDSSLSPGYAFTYASTPTEGGVTGDFGMGTNAQGTNTAVGSTPFPGQGQSLSTHYDVGSKMDERNNSVEAILEPAQAARLDHDQQYPPSYTPATTNPSPPRLSTVSYRASTTASGPPLVAPANTPDARSTNGAAPMPSQKAKKLGSKTSSLSLLAYPSEWLAHAQERIAEKPAEALFWTGFLAPWCWLIGGWMLARSNGATPPAGLPVGVDPDEAMRSGSTYALHLQMHRMRERELQMAKVHAHGGSSHMAHHATRAHSHIHAPTHGHDGHGNRQNTQDRGQSESRTSLDQLQVGLNEKFAGGGSAPVPAATSPTLCEHFPNINHETENARIRHPFASNSAVELLPSKSSQAATATVLNTATSNPSQAQPSQGNMTNQLAKLEECCACASASSWNVNLEAGRDGGTTQQQLHSCPACARYGSDTAKVLALAQERLKVDPWVARCRIAAVVSGMLILAVCIIALVVLVRSLSS